MKYEDLYVGQHLRHKLGVENLAEGEVVLVAALRGDFFVVRNAKYDHALQRSYLPCFEKIAS